MIITNYYNMLFFVFQYLIIDSWKFFKLFSLFCVYFGIFQGKRFVKKMKKPDRFLVCQGRCCFVGMILYSGFHFYSMEKSLLGFLLTLS